MDNRNERFRLLQLFADGAGAAAGEAAEAAAPGQTARQRLEALGVPKDKLRGKPEGTLQSADQPSGPREAQQPAAKPTWEQLMEDEDYNREMQRIVRERLKGSKAAQERLEKLNPALEALSRFYHVDGGDTDALVQAISGDDRLYEDRARELGVSAGMARHISELEQSRAELERTRARQQLEEHVRQLRRQEQELQKVYPGFSLSSELENPAFRRMTAPGSGISLEDAFYAVHHRELQSAAAQVTARTVAEKLSGSLQANARRPVEAGTIPQAPSLAAVDYSKMTRQQRQELKRRIMQAAAQGRKIYPGE